MIKLLSFIKARLKERSTWVSFGLAVTVASALPRPWDIVSCVIGIIGGIVPDGSINPVKSSKDCN